MHCKQNIFSCLTGNVFLFTLKRIYISLRFVKKLLIKVVMIIYCKE